MAGVGFHLLRVAAGGIHSVLGFLLGCNLLWGAMATRPPVAYSVLYSDWLLIGTLLHGTSWLDQTSTP